MSSRSLGTNGAPEVVNVKLEHVALWAPPRRRSARSGDNGVVLVVGGSRFKHGGVVLAALAALITGVDEVYIATPEKLATPVRSLTPDCNIIPLPDYKLTRGAARRLLKWLPGGVNAALIGASLQKGSVEGACILAQELAVDGVKLVLSSEGSRSEVLARVPGREFIASYSRGSFREVFNEELPDKQEVSRMVEVVSNRAREVKGCILVKGVVDVVTNGSRAYVNTSGSPGMTVWGVGAIVDGLITGFMGRGLDPLRAGAAAVYVAGVAGEMVASEKGFHFKASDLLAKIPRVLMRFDTMEEG